MAGKHWQAIESHPVERLDKLFEAEPDRLSRLSFDVAGIYFDWSKTHLDAGLLEAFTDFSREMGFAAARDALFGGDIVNPSEGQAAEHVAERGNGSPDAVELANARRQRMRALVDAIEAGAFGDVTGILHIGIGGSVLGPEMLVDALGRRRAGYLVRFLSNIDGEAFDEAVTDLDPATTLVVVASKTFTTTETLANMGAALRWPSPKASAAATRCGARSASRRRWCWAGTRSRNCSKGRRKWTATSASRKAPPTCRCSPPSPTGSMPASSGARRARCSLTTNGCGFCRRTFSSWRWSRTASR
jgi:hypothetical protein